MLSGCNVPLIASGGAGSVNDFIDVFKQTNVSGALAASIFHKNIINIQQLKQNLRTELINIR
jgi:cyclase